MEHTHGNELVMTRHPHVELADDVVGKLNRSGYTLCCWC